MALLGVLFLLVSFGCQRSIDTVPSEEPNQYEEIPDHTDNDPNPDDDDDDDTVDGTGGAGQLTLPFAEDEHWQMTRGYNTGSHIDYGYDWVDDRYALDFSLPGCEPWRKPIHPIQNGTVELIGYNSTGYGNYVLIDHGDGYKSRYAHFDETLVEVGEFVTPDEVIGLAGNSGNVIGSACPEHPGTHLHLAYYRYGEGLRPEPMSGHVNFTEDCWYGHDNWIDCNGDGQPDNSGDDDDDDDTTEPPTPSDDDDDTTPNCLDNDGDGYGIGADCLGEDCHDGNSTIHPGAPEMLDAYDNDCDGEIDEGLTGDDDDDTTEPPTPPGDGDDDDDDDTTEPPTPGDDDDTTEPPTPSDPCDWTVPTDTATIQAALNLVGASSTNGQMICVEAGSYSEDLVFPNVELALVSMDGAGATHLYGVGTDLYDAAITIAGGQSRATLLQGFTLHGAGTNVLWVDGASPTLKNLEVNAAGIGYGIGFFTSAALLQNVHIENADTYGVTAWGGSIGLTFENVLIEGNGLEGVRAGGGSNLLFVNTVFHGNGTVGLHLFDAGATLMNSIVTSHTMAGVMKNEPAYPFTSSYNVYYGNAIALDGTGLAMGLGDDWQNPLFGNTWTNNFTLQGGSWAINTGNPSTTYNDANGTRNDKGAYGGPLSMSW